MLETSITQFRIRRPDDFHVHFRTGSVCEKVVPWTAKHFGRALVMPNVPAIEKGKQAKSYFDEIVRPDIPHFRPLMTIKLTHRTTPEMISQAKGAGVVAAKLYPQGVTTGSHDGVVNPDLLYPIFECMDKVGMVLCVHAECPYSFILNRERIYVSYFENIIRDFPCLRIVIEHISTKFSVDFVRSMASNVAATITVHHLYNTLDDVLGNGLRPHNFCYPVAKTEEDRIALCRAARGEYGQSFFFGSDSAPHLQHDKESACGCAGVFNAPAALPALCSLFMGEGGKQKVFLKEEQEDNIETLQSFLSERGACFYKLPRNQDFIQLIRQPFRVPENVDGIIPWMSGIEFPWSVS